MKLVEMYEGTPVYIREESNFENKIQITYSETSEFIQTHLLTSFYLF